MSVVVAIPAYRSVVDVRTMGTVLALATSPLEVRGVLVEDGMLDLSRNRLMARALASGAEWMIGLDSDVSLNPGAVGELGEVLRAAASKPALALVGFPARTNRGEWGVVLAGANLDTELLEGAELLEVDAVSFCAFALRLPWLRQHWPAGVPYVQSRVVRDRGEFALLGEDYAFCRAVRGLGGRVVVDGRVPARHHFGRAMPAPSVL